MLNTTATDCCVVCCECAVQHSLHISFPVHFIVLHFSFAAAAETRSPITWVQLCWFASSESSLLYHFAFRSWFIIIIMDWLLVPPLLPLPPSSSSSSLSPSVMYLCTWLLLLLLLSLPPATTTQCTWFASAPSLSSRCVLFPKPQPILGRRWTPIDHCENIDEGETLWQPIITSASH